MKVDMRIDSLDHLVLTVANLRHTCDFYGRVLGRSIVTFGEGRTALAFGSQKINLHLKGHEFVPRAQSPTPGSADFCLITSVPIDAAMEHVRREGVAIELGPVDKTGAVGKLRSFYFRDPDMNLVEVSNYVAS
jgi:catechol 2,3-dioxygenase-like lactoylglutathione lyase family enzyme